MHEKTFLSPYQWNFYGASGRATFQGSFGRRWRSPRGDDLIVADISISALWPDRTNEVISFHKMLKDFSVNLPQVILSVESLTALSKAVSEWSEQSESVVQNLCPNEGDQTLSIYISAADRQRGLSNFTLHISYSCTVFDTAAWSFVVDQSCIRIFSDELSASLERILRV